MRRRRSTALNPVTRSSSLALHRLARAALLAAATIGLGTSRADAQAPVPQGVWLYDAKAAVQIYGCEDRMCGRIQWLLVPRNPEGQLDRDKHNPDPVLRRRQLCGLTMIWGLQPSGVDRWKNGWFYNPDDGATYRVSAYLKSADVIVVRIYVGVSLLGKTKTLVRVPQETSEGWC